MPKIDGFSIRIGSNDMIWLPRYNRKAIEHFDKYYEKIGKWQWKKRVHGPPTAGTLKFKYQDQSCYIVGKGASLVNLSAKTFGILSVPIIAINEAIDAVQKQNLYPDTPVFFMQQDAEPEAHPIDHTIGILHDDIGDRYTELTKRHIFMDNDFGFPRKVMTVFAAIALAKYMGCVQVFMVSFDYAVSGDISYPEGVTDHRKGTEAWKFLKERIAIAAGHMAVDYITPLPEVVCEMSIDDLPDPSPIAEDITPIKLSPSPLTNQDHDLSSAYILEPSPHNLEEHHE